MYLPINGKNMFNGSGLRNKYQESHGKPHENLISTGKFHGFQLRIPVQPMKTARVNSSSPGHAQVPSPHLEDTSSRAPGDTVHVILMISVPRTSAVAAWNRGESVGIIVIF